MPNMEYDRSVGSLLFPGRAPTVFRAGAVNDPVQLAAEFSRIAYYRFEDGSRARLEQDLAIAGFGQVRSFVAGSSQAFGAQRSDLAILAFRGTEPKEPADLLADLMALAVPWSGDGLVHAGFALAYAGLRDEVAAWVKQIRAGRRLLFCGHSLGAALATLAASELQPELLVTVASPRVGNRRFLDTLARVEHTRLVNCADAVTQVPPAIVYEHPAQLLYINHLGELLRNPSKELVEADQRAGRDSYTHRADELPSRRLADHAPVNYLRALFP